MKYLFFVFTIAIAAGTATAQQDVSHKFIGEWYGENSTLYIERDRTFTLCDDGLCNEAYLSAIAHPEYIIFYLFHREVLIDLQFSVVFIDEDTIELTDIGTKKTYTFQKESDESIRRRNEQTLAFWGVVLLGGFSLLDVFDGGGDHPDDFADERERIKRKKMEEAKQAQYDSGIIGSGY